MPDPSVVNRASPPRSTAWLTGCRVMAGGRMFTVSDDGALRVVPPALLTATEYCPSLPRSTLVRVRVAPLIACA